MSQAMTQKYSEIFMSQAVTQKCSKIFNEAHVFLTDLFALQDKYRFFIVFGLILALLLARTFSFLLYRLKSYFSEIFKWKIVSFSGKKSIDFFEWFMSVCETAFEFFNKLLFLNIFLCYFLKDYFNSNSSEIPFLKHFNYFSFFIIILVLYFLPKEFNGHDFEKKIDNFRNILHFKRSTTEYITYALVLVYKFFVPMILFHFKSQMTGSFLFLIVSALLVFPTIVQRLENLLSKNSSEFGWQ
jgi:hypothetical protein